MPGVNIGTPSNAGLYSGTATPIMNGASQGSNYMASYPDATGQLMSRTQAENATKNYLGTIDGITPTAEDQKSYTDKTYLELKGAPLAATLFPIRAA